MIVHDLTQGTEGWHEFRRSHFTASDAAAMLGLSKHKTRNQLLREKVTGKSEPVSKSKQAIFDKGHAAEDRARPIIEKEIGEELYPATASCDEWEKIAASFDGITMLDDIVWEHKLFNQALANYINEHNDLPDTHWPQAEQQLCVSGAEIYFFTTSDGNGDERHAQIQYTSKPERLKQLLDGWKQFETDMENFVDEPQKEAVKGEVVLALPEPTFTLDKNNLTVTSNLSVFKEAAHQLVEKAKQPLNTEQDFANAENMVKEFKRSEGKLDGLRKAVMADIDDVSVFIADVDEIKELIRQARLATDKQVKSRKEEIKRDIVTKAETELQKIVIKNGDQLNVSFEFDADFSIAIKGKRNLDSIQAAVDTTLANAKIQIQNQIELVEENLAYLNEQTQYKFLFNDWSLIAFKPLEDFINEVDRRIANHKVDEENRIQAEAERQAKEAQKPIEETQTTAADTPFSAPSLDKAKQNMDSVLSQVPVEPLQAAEQEQMVRIPVAEYKRLLEADEKLNALLAAGVDNWTGYDEAMEMMEVA